MKSGIFSKIVDRFDQMRSDEVRGFLKRLSRERGQIEHILASLPQGVVILDDDSRIQFFNAAAVDLLGLRPTAIQERLERHVRGADWHRLAPSQQSESFQLTVDYPERRFLEVTTIPLTPDQRDEFGCAIIFHDATQTLRTASDAAAAERVAVMTHLTAGVAHELGNPLNSFNIQLQLLDRELKRGPDCNTQKMSHLVHLARNEVARLDGMIKNFLGAVRPSQPQLQPTSLNTVVQESLDFFAQELADREIHLKTHLAKALPLIPIDANQIKQVLFNLIKNVIEVLTPGQSLTLSTRLEERFVILSVRDSGPGISPEVQSRLFQPFFTTKSEGTGLGLVIVSRIVRDHGGLLSVDSELGHGTEFRVKLPLPGYRTPLLSSHIDSVDSAESPLATASRSTPLIEIAPPKKAKRRTPKK